jgi:4'-phosphopantetheinyl transferase EntD
VDDQRAEEALMLIRRLRAHLPAGLKLCAARASDRTELLDHTELEAVAAAVLSRRSEFSTGRWLARRALGELSLPSLPIPAGRARQPVWPDGAVGSISHSGTVCAAIVGRAQDYRGVGLDLELVDGLEADLADIVLAPCEPPGYREARLLRLVFSAKESVYKCLYPLRGVFIDFHDVQIAIDERHETFAAVPLAESAAGARHGVGRFVLGKHCVATVFTIAAAPLA